MGRCVLLVGIVVVIFVDVAWFGTAGAKLASTETEGLESGDEDGEHVGIREQSAGGGGANNRTFFFASGACSFAGDTSGPYDSYDSYYSYDNYDGYDSYDNYENFEENRQHYESYEDITESKETAVQYFDSPGEYDGYHNRRNGHDYGDDGHGRTNAAHHHTNGYRYNRPSHHDNRHDAYRPRTW